MYYWKLIIILLLNCTFFLNYFFGPKCLCYFSKIINPSNSWCTTVIQMRLISISMEYNNTTRDGPVIYKSNAERFHCIFHTSRQCLIIQFRFYGKLGQLNILNPLYGFTLSTMILPQFRFIGKLGQLNIKPLYGFTLSTMILPQFRFYGKLGQLIILKPLYGITLFTMILPCLVIQFRFYGKLGQLNILKPLYGLTFFTMILPCLVIQFRFYGKLGQLNILKPLYGFNDLYYDSSLSCNAV